MSEKGKVLSLRDMAGAFLAGGSAALIAAFTAIPLPGAETVLHPQGRSAAEDGAGQLFCFSRCKAGMAGRLMPGVLLSSGHPGGGK